MNAFWHGKVGNSVWRNYRLIGSQWQAIVPGYPKSDTSNAPPILGNSSLESYIPSTSSCISCHTFGQTAGAPAKFADFSFLLGMAGEKPSAMAPFAIERRALQSLPAGQAPAESTRAGAPPPPPPPGGQPRRR